MELVLEHDRMCKKISQIVEERMICNCEYTIRLNEDDKIAGISFTVKLLDYNFRHEHIVHIRELERCIEYNNGSVLSIAQIIVKAVEESLLASIYR